MDTAAVGQGNTGWESTLSSFPPGEYGPKRVELDEFQSTIMRNVSHELRTPLAIIQAYAELLHDGELGDLAPQQQNALFTIVDRAHQLRTLVERIGVLMAIQAHRSLALPFALNEVVVQVMAERQSAATEAGQALEVHIEPNLPLVSGDFDHMRQAVDCLLDNALKFTPAGGRVEARVYSEPGWVCLDIVDTGIGLEKDALQEIFTPFYQRDASTTRRYGGLGLGLSVVQAVIEEHGGQIEVESQAGQGSRFTACLPTLPSAPRGKQAPEGDPARRRILVVDDEKIVARTLQGALKRLPNCEISVADSGEQALQLFAAQPFHLLITDYRMPGMDGLALATRVRRLYPRTIIIIVTAYSSDDLRESAARASIRRILDKPLEIAEIRRATLEALCEPSLPIVSTRPENHETENIS